MLFVTLVSVLLVSAPHFAQAQSVCTQEVNTDYFGNDLSYVFVADVGACCNLCSFYPNCQSWTFVSTVNACWLKSTASPTKVASAGRTSGLKANSTVTVAPVTTTAAPTTVTVVTTTVTTVTTPTTPATTVTTAASTPVTTAAPSTTTTTGASTTTKEYGCFIENNINYIGNDLSSQFVNTMGDCCNLCGATTGCVVWAYWADFKFCYLKNQLPSISQRQPFNNMFSGIITLN